MRESQHEIDKIIYDLHEKTEVSTTKIFFLAHHSGSPYEEVKWKMQQKCLNYCKNITKWLQCLINLVLIG